jgi:thioredoxin-like negative regulator of GroEL
MFKKLLLIVSLCVVINAKALTPKNYTQYINSHNFVLVEFWYPDCPYCTQLKPHLDAALRKLPGINFATFNTDYDDNAVIRDQYNVQVTPTLVIYKNGVEVSRQISDMSTQDIVNWVKQYR